MQHSGAPEVIVTVTSSGEETQNTLEAGDFLVQNLPGGERYVVKAERFRARYLVDKAEAPRPLPGRPAAQLAAEGWRFFPASGKVLQHVVTKQDLAEHFPTGSFMAPWGQPMAVREGDSLVMPLPDVAEVYRIDAAEFEATYELDV